MTPVIKLRRVRPSSLPLPRYQSADAAGIHEAFVLRGAQHDQERRGS